MYSEYKHRYSVFTGYKQKEPTFMDKMDIQLLRNQS